jgi:hypothetical protein
MGLISSIVAHDTDFKKGEETSSASGTRLYKELYVESTVNLVISKHFVKKQQMR